MRVDGKFTTLSELAEFLRSTYPPRCIETGQSVEDAHRYAGKSALASLILRKISTPVEDIEFDIAGKV